MRVWDKWCTDGPMMRTKEETLKLRLDKESKRQLLRHAGALGISASEAIRAAIRNWNASQRRKLGGAV